MSSALRRGAAGWAGAWAAAMIALLASPALARAQGGVFSEAGLQTLQAEFDASRGHYLRVKARADAVLEELRADEEAHFAERLDTVSAGPFTLVGRAEDLPVAGAIFAEEWARYRDALGLSDDWAPASPAVYLARSDEDGIRRVAPSGSALVQIREWREARPVWSDPAGSFFATMVRSTLPAALRSWSRGSPLAEDFSSDRAVREFYLHPSPLAGSCRRGSDDACMELLLWNDVAPPGTLEPDVRARWDARIERLYPGDAWRAVLNRCAAPLEPSDCFEGLTFTEWQEFVRPAAAHLQASLLRAALELGGGKGLAAAALLPDDASEVETLEALAQAPLGELLAEWRAGLLAAEAGPGIDPADATRTVLWIVFFGLTALRSTRWRFS